MFGFFRIIPKERKVKIRRKFGLIYRNPPLGNKIFFALNNVLLVLALTYLIYLYWPIITAYGRYRQNLANWVEEEDADLIFPDPGLELANKFIIKIPKIMAEAEIVENVSPYDREEYLKVLENDRVAQAKGSALPGDGKGKTVYLFAHSSQQGIGMTRKNPVFYLLGEMNEGDEIFLNYQAKIYTYQVYQKKILRADEAEILNYQHENEEVLLLQTCWPIGTDWKRLVVFAKKSE